MGRRKERPFVKDGDGDGEEVEEEEEEEAVEGIEAVVEIDKEVEEVEEADGKEEMIQHQDKEAEQVEENIGLGIANGTLGDHHGKGDPALYVFNRPTDAVTLTK